MNTNFNDVCKLVKHKYGKKCVQNITSYYSSVAVTDGFVQLS